MPHSTLVDPALATLAQSKFADSAPDVAAALRINDIAPNFTAQTTQGKINFHDWIGDKWAILFSHPKDFTPVCTTELGYMAKIEPEFTKRNTKLIGLSVDPVDSHSRWLSDIEETQGAKVDYPIIADHGLKVSKQLDGGSCRYVPIVVLTRFSLGVSGDW
jgi:alkyl hydroperoxide reductase subunit AhpC